MNIDVSSDIKGMVNDMKERADKVPTAVSKAVYDCAGEVVKECRIKLANEVYDQPIPTRTSHAGNRVYALKTGRKTSYTAGGIDLKRKPNGATAAWRRTNSLMRGERIYPEGEFKATVDNRTPYALYRHELNKPSRIDGKVRRAPWRQDAMDVVEPKVRAIVDNALKVITD